jgi:hypothetical protein
MEGDGPSCGRVLGEWGRERILHLEKPTTISRLNQIDFVGCMAK